MSQHVFLVLHNLHWESVTVEGVFSSYELAREFVDEQYAGWIPQDEDEDDCLEWKDGESPNCTATVEIREWALDGEEVE